jgi:hypothetical protein
MVVSLDQVFIGKETHPLASIDEDNLIEEDEDIFAAGQRVIDDGLVINQPVFEEYGERINEQIVAWHNWYSAEDRKPPADNMRLIIDKIFSVDEHGAIAIKGPPAESLDPGKDWVRAQAKLIKFGKLSSVSTYETDWAG